MVEARSLAGGREGKTPRKVKDRFSRPLYFNDTQRLYCSICSKSTSVFQPEPKKMVHWHKDSSFWQSSARFESKDELTVAVEGVV